MALTKGQKVWYLDHFSHKIEEGTLKSIKDASNRDEYPTLYVQGKYGTERILTDWVFSTKERADKGLKKYIRQQIRRKRKEIKHLERFLKS